MWTTFYSNLSEITVKSITQDVCIINGYAEEFGEFPKDHLFLIGIHSLQDWTATTRDGVTRKRSKKILKHTGNLLRKNLQLKRCLLILDLKPFRS